MRGPLSYALGALLLLAGVALLVLSPTNTSFEGWAMLVRALAGQALVIAAIDLLARSSPNRARRRRRALLVTSGILLPLSAFVFLMSRESGDSWSIAALVLFVWYLGSVIYVVTRRATRSQAS